MGEGLDRVFHLFHRLLGSPATPCTDDGELLDSFIRRRDEKAFEDLVRRHGPMVLGACRRVLRDPHAAEDAFQVTFLTLACKAASLRRGQALAAWLHRVAFRIALRIRSRGRRAADVEREAPPMSRPDHETEAGWRELPAVLDEELQRLPEILRGPLVLCGLEGKTHEEAARQLGWPTGSLSKRLARGRELLRQRLARRGFALGVAGGLIADATAAVPEPLLGTTIKRAVAAAAGRTAELPAATAALLREALRTMFWTPLKVMVLALAILVAPAAGLGLFALLCAEPPLAPRPEKPGREEARPAPAEPAGFGKLIAALGPKKFRFRSVFLGVAASPDGKLFAVSDAHVVHLYDAASKKLLRTWQGLDGYSIRSLAFSPNNKVLAAADGSKELRLWDVTTGKLRRTFNTHYSAHSVIFSPDGKLLATTGEADSGSGKRGDLWIPGMHSVRVWELATGKELAGFAGGLSTGYWAAFSPDSRLLAWAGFDNKVHIRPLAEGKDLFTYTAKPQQGKLSFSSLEFSPDGKVLAVGNDGVIKLFEVVTGKQRRTLAHPPKGGQPALLDGYGMRFSPDGKTLASISQGGVCLWDVASGKALRFLHEYGTQPPTSLAFCRNGRRLITGNANDQTVRFWDVPSGRQEFEPGHHWPVNGVALSPDGKTVVTSSSGEGVRFWDRQGKELRRLSGVPVTALSYAADRRLRIIGADKAGYLHFCDPETGKVQGRIGKDLWRGMAQALSRDGKLLAVAQSEIRIVELPSGKDKVRLPGHGSYTSCLAFGPDGKSLVSGGQETVMPKQTYAVKMWDLTTGKELRRLPHPELYTPYRIAYSPDGRYVLTNLHTYDLGPPPLAKQATAKVVVGPAIAGSINWPGNLPVFSPDGKLLAVANESGQPQNKVWIDLWEVAGWKKVATLEGHTQRVLALAFSANGRFLVSGSQDTSARVWDLRRSP